MGYSGFPNNGHADARTASPRQEPFLYGSLGGRTISIVDAPASSSASPAPSVADPAAQAWAAVKDANSIAALEAFIRRFGDSFYADWARLRIDELKKQQTAEIVPPVPPVVGPLVVPPAVAGPCGGVSTVPLSSRGAAPTALAKIAGERAVNSKTWPANPRALAGRLRRAATFLRKSGIEIVFEREGRARTRIIRITNIANHSAPEVGGAEPSVPSASAASMVKSSAAQVSPGSDPRTVANRVDGPTDANDLSSAPKPP